MTGWKQDKRWSDKFLPPIKRILGEHLIAEPPVEEDQFRNSDLMVLNLNSIRVGCRVRRHSYLERYGSQFTIRAERGSGSKTELQKIVEGWGDYLFYGFSNESETDICRWVLVDLYALRWHLFRHFRGDKHLMSNHDGSSRFAAINWSPSDDFVFACDQTNRQAVAS